MYSVWSTGEYRIVDMLSGINDKVPTRTTSFGVHCTLDTEAVIILMIKAIRSGLTPLRMIA